MASLFILPHYQNRSPFGNHCFLHRLKQMVRGMDIATLDELRKTYEPVAMVHDVMIATFLVLSEDDGVAKVQVL